MARPGRTGIQTISPGAGPIVAEYDTIVNMRIIAFISPLLLALFSSMGYKVTRLKHGLPKPSHRNRPPRLEHSYLSVLKVPAAAAAARAKEVPWVTNLPLV